MNNHQLNFSNADHFNLNEVINRRQQIIKKIRQHSGSGLLLIANFENISFDRNFYYFSGITQTSSILLISVDKINSNSVIFVADKNTDKELWQGEMLSIKDAKTKYRFDQAFYLSEFETEFTKFILPHRYLYYDFNVSSKLGQQIFSAIDKKRSQQRLGVIPIHAIFDSRIMIDDMRKIKSKFEIDQIKYACRASANAITDAMISVKSGINEREIMGILYKKYYQYNLSGPAYPPIVGSGKNSCVLHYSTNNQRINKHSLVLIDAAGEYYGYCADITRTVPANKKFSIAQKAVYEIVLKAQKQAITFVKKGLSIGEYHQVALRIIVEGLRDLKLLKGSVDQIISQGSYKKFYMHQAGHFLGLDTHDVGIYRENDQWQNFQPGMLVTVEPGIYIRSDNTIPKEFHNIGIRLEDDILVTNNGNQNLTASAPIEIDDIEALY